MFWSCIKAARVAEFEGERRLDNMSGGRPPN